MAHIYQKWHKILELIFKDSINGFSVREISKKTRIPSSSVQRYLKALKEEGIIKDDNSGNVTNYFKFLKTFFMLDKIYASGLIDYLLKEYNPDTIIIFGSIRKGEYDAQSDIDLFVESSIQKEINLKGFEKKLGHKIQLFVELNIHNLQKELFNNVINGIKLFGSFKIK